jgi:CheY-like chemotaxis protein
MNGSVGMESDKNKKRILAIEDEPIISHICVRVLTADGFEVDVAHNGLIAKDMAGKATYDLYLSDIRTPTMNGIEFFEYMKQTQPELKSRVVFTTGDVMSLEIKTFLSKNDNFFLAKPFTPDELRTVIKKAMKPRAS